MARKANKQEFAVIGLGRFGTAVARELLARGHTVLGIDRSREVVQPLSDELTEALILDATDEDALRSVDIALYDAVVVAINDDFEDELLTTLTLKSLGVKRVVGVASDERQKTILLKVGADEVVMPEHDSGERLGLLLSLPNLVERVALGQEHTIAETAHAQNPGRSHRGGHRLHGDVSRDADGDQTRRKIDHAAGPGPAVVQR